MKENTSPVISDVDLSIVKKLADDNKNINIAKQSLLGNALFRYL